MGLRDLPQLNRAILNTRFIRFLNLLLQFGNLHFSLHTGIQQLPKGQ